MNLTGKRNLEMITRGNQKKRIENILITIATKSELKKKRFLKKEKE